MNRFILLVCLALAAASIHAKKHVMSGKVTVNDEVENVQGRRQISTEADLLMPIVPWEELSRDGVTIEKCFPMFIKFVGPVDEEDFVEGNVLTFPKDDYLAMGCPLPPATDDLSKLDEVIFREITLVKFFNGGVRVRTEFVSGADVAPKVVVHVGELVSPAARIVETGKRLLELNTVSRVNDIGITAFDESGNFEIVSGVGLDWSIKATAGICEFDFDRFPPKATWEQRVKVEAMASLSATFSFEKTDSGELLNVPILGAGFDKKIFLVGTISFGLFAKVDYDLAIKATASVVASFSGSFETGQRVKVSLGGFDADSLASSSDGSIGDFNFTGPTVDAALDVDGFAGLRPAIAAVLSLPIIGDATAEIGATIGLQLDINYKDPAFPAVAGGTTIGTCDSCHFVEGTLDLQGRKFSVEGKVPVLGSKEVIIDDSFLDIRLGTACAFATTCAATTPTTSAPTVKGDTQAATTTASETPCMAFSVPGTCISTGACAAKGSFSQAGLCPGPADIQCCVPNFGRCSSETAGATGVCTKGCSGMTEVNLCPGDSSITCCFA